MCAHKRKGETLSNQESRPVSRRTVVAGAAWSVPIIAVAVATPAHAASIPPEAPTSIQLTLQPTPPVPYEPARLTYKGVVDFVEVPFPIGSTATVVISGPLEGLTFDGLTQVSVVGSDPVTYTFAIANLSGFYVQGTPSPGTEIAVVVSDGIGRIIGSGITTVDSDEIPGGGIPGG